MAQAPASASAARSGMFQPLAHVGAWCAGATLGGAVVGLCEAIYRQAPWWYAAALYATLWAVGGALLGGSTALLGPRRAAFTTGITVALGSSTWILMHFILWRDVFLEAPGRNVVAWAAAMLIASLVAAVAWGLASLARTRALGGDAVRTLGGHISFAVPAIAVGLFALLAWPRANIEPGAVPPPAHPNKAQGVILIVADALRADALGVFGAEAHRGRAATPHIDALADGATVFTQAHAQASWTKPAMASLLTSRSVPGHNTMAKNAMLPAQLPTLASELSRHGVHTGAVVTNYNLEQAFGFDRGFTDFAYLPPTRYLNAPAAANRLAAYNVYRLLRERFWRAGRRSEYFYQSGTAVNRAALQFVDAHPQGSFFLWLHYMETHDPYFDVDGQTSWARVSDPHPDASAAAAMTRAYRDGVHRLDDALGDLFAALARRGLDSSRLTIVLTADHGEEFGDHGGFYHGTSLYQELVHIPLIIKSPHLAPGMHEGIVRHIDVAPTVLHQFGVVPPAAWEGTSLLQNATREVTWADEDHEGHVLHAIEVDGLKWIHANSDNPRGLPVDALFDLARDPHELQPRPLDVAQVQMLQQRRSAATDANRPIAPATGRTLDAASQAELRSLGYVQ